MNLGFPSLASAPRSLGATRLTLVLIATHFLVASLSGAANAQSTSTPAHKLLGPDDFAALQLTAKTSASEVRSLFSGDPQSTQFSWTKYGIDASCQKVQITAERSMGGRVVQTDPRAFKLVTDQDFMVMKKGVPGFMGSGTACSVKFMGEMISAIMCSGFDGTEGSKTVLEQFRDRFGEADRVVKGPTATVAEWHCPSGVPRDDMDYRAKFRCIVEIRSEPHFCGENKTCRRYQLNFQRNVNDDAKKMREREELLQKNKCAP
jgi:hypothetical protein